MLEFDFSKLQGRIIEKYGTRSAFASAWGVTDVFLSNRLNNKVRFDAFEIHQVVCLLDIPAKSISEYFFEPKVV